MLRTRPRTIALSDEAVLFYVLHHSGVMGHLTSGSLEQTTGNLDVFDAYGNRIEYLSGRRLRSWRVLGRDGQTIEGWSKILEEDLHKIGLS